MNIAIVASTYYRDIVDKAIAAAKDEIEKNNATLITIVEVPGVFDIPLMVKKLLQRSDVDAVVTLGTVVKGVSDHDQVVAHNTARKIADLTIEFEKPISLSIAGPGLTKKQGEERAEPYARHGVQTVIKLINNMTALK
jgi:6,7-dimethyl-8-ribityllumazine synthase